MRISYCSGAVFSFAFLLFGLAISYAEAAPLVTFDVPGEVGEGETFVVRVLLSTDVALNTIEAFLVYPTTLLELVSVDRGSSIFDLWPTEPDQSVPGSVAFEAGARRAFVGDGGRVIALEFHARGSGTASLSFEELAVYAADGTGMRVQAAVVPVSILISQNGTQPMPTVLRGSRRGSDRMSDGPDTTPPLFTEFAVVESPVDGARLLAFEAQDEGSGVLYVESRERGLFPWWGEWRRVVTPRALRKDVRAVELRATDRAGKSVVERIKVREGSGTLIVVTGVTFSLAVLSFFLWKINRRYHVAGMIE